MNRFGERAPSERSSSSGWGYKIDYAKEIAQDDARIAHLSSPLCIRVSQELLPEAMQEFPRYSDWDVYQLVTRNPAAVEPRAAVFGLTRDDVRAWAYFCNEERPALWDALGDHQPGDQARGKAIDTRFDRCAFEVFTESARVFSLRKARARRARHVRNAEKYGA